MAIPTTNGSTRGRELPAGIYCPTLTFFKDTKAQELDTETYARHIEFLAKSGIEGVVALGSTAETVALSREERKEVIRLTNTVFKQYSPNGTVTAGTGSNQSTREAIELCGDAAEAGADFVLVLPPCYFAGALTQAAIQEFYEDVADASPVPLVIYSYPAVSSGIVLNTDLVGQLARHPNIVGIKHTDHEVGRIAREASIKSYGSPFTVLGGASDYLMGTLAVGGKGAITGMANITPRVLVKIYELAQAGQLQEALELAGLISRSEWALGKGGIIGTKYATQWVCGYPSSAALARKPLPLVVDAVKQNVEQELAEVVALERKLEKEGFVGSLLSGRPKTAVNGHASGTNSTQSNGGIVETLKQKVAAI